MWGHIGKVMVEQCGGRWNSKVEQCGGTVKQSGWNSVVEQWNSHNGTMWWNSGKVMVEHCGGRV